MAANSLAPPGTSRATSVDSSYGVMAQLVADGKLTRRDVEEKLDVSDRTAKRVLGELSDAGLIEFERTSYPGFYRLK